jgi:bifunctional non-homologous end joining protein LigD/DNA ligase-1
MLAVPADPFDHPDYLFEVKWDGYRCLAYIEQQSVKLISRNAKNITVAFPDLEDLYSRTAKAPAVLDGEIIVLHQGKPSFEALQSRAGLGDKDRARRAALKLPSIYMAFDVLYCAGRPLLDRPLYERRAWLQEVVHAGHNLLISEQVQEHGVLFYRACVEKGLEGAMAKKMDSKYRPGARSALWKKIRHTREADLVICGYRAGRGKRLLGSLVLAAWDGTRYVYQGMVGSGLSRDEEQELLQKLAVWRIDRPLLENDALPGIINWVLPRLVCRVEYLTLTGDGILRHPVYQGLRADKAPEECPPAKMQNTTEKFQDK